MKSADLRKDPQDKEDLDEPTSDSIDRVRLIGLGDWRFGVYNRLDLLDKVDTWPKNGNVEEVSLKDWVIGRVQFNKKEPTLGEAFG